ncbi:DUF5057 domain-containing protein [Bombilactobacillus folatiphilus]|uniref:DUF5057 domain-containing protein n=1 Tax=Bombilactobacillus folatiphilus TaxID=2923362 RepID=A0ABY4P8R4_9LACO|nr:DUF5057 domain-containing protein [Bombilactobacillus folatiphilus]UQS81986.1 DUF5057 domain-containing protein [Bombilactobacillus folatiphilus]
MTAGTGAQSVSPDAKFSSLLKQSSFDQLLTDTDMANLQHHVTGTTVSSGDFHLTTSAGFDPATNTWVTKLDWDPLANLSDGYVVQKAQGTADEANIFNLDWKNTPTNYGKKVKVLNVYPDDGNFLKDWLNQNTPDGQLVSGGLIDATPVSMTAFNANPSAYLKDSAGQYDYDCLYFGSHDVGGDDLSAATLTAVQTFGNTGRSVIFGHDTVRNTFHPNYASFANKLGIKSVTVNAGYPTKMGSQQIEFTPELKNGLLTKYPNDLFQNGHANVFNVSPSHDEGQFYMYNNDSGAQRWMQYVGPPYYSWGKSDPNDPHHGQLVSIGYLHKTKPYESSEYAGITTNPTDAIGDDNAYLTTNK